MIIKHNDRTNNKYFLSYQTADITSQMIKKIYLKWILNEYEIKYNIK